MIGVAELLPPRDLNKNTILNTPLQVSEQYLPFGLRRREVHDTQDYKYMYCSIMYLKSVNFTFILNTMKGFVVNVTFLEYNAMRNSSNYVHSEHC